MKDGHRHQGEQHGVDDGREPADAPRSAGHHAALGAALVAVDGADREKDFAAELRGLLDPGLVGPRHHCGDVLSLERLL